MDLVRQSLAITFVFALLWGALWLLRKKGSLRVRRSNAGNLIESSAQLTLTGQHSIHLIRIGQHELVLAVHPGGITLLCDLGKGSNAGSQQ